MIVDGVVSPFVTKWFIECALDRGGVGRGASLERYAQAMKRFAQYYQCYGQKQSGTELVRGFSQALDIGDDTLRWKQLSFDAGNSYFDALCQFFDWVAKQPGYDALQHPNPIILQPMTPFEREASNAQRREQDMLYHLHSTSSDGRGLKKIRKIRFETRFNRPHILHRQSPESEDAQPIGRRPKGMPFEDFMKLLRFEKSPRNLLLWLTLGAGACRISESLQMFATDVIWDDENATALVALANPIKGLVLGRNGIYVERAKYLRTQYGILPRCDLPKSNPLHAGWKGMIEGGFSDDMRSAISDWPRRRWTPMEFLLPRFGRMFWRAHKIYQRQLMALRPTHPYYFVNLKKNCGKPMTRSNVDQVLATSCRRAGIPMVRPHRLRHMYGICLSSWRISIQEAQVMMRHASVKSTRVYYPIQGTDMREKLAKVDADRRAKEMEDDLFSK